jgi:hypothetical protein
MVLQCIVIDGQHALITRRSVRLLHLLYTRAWVPETAIDPNPAHARKAIARLRSELRQAIPHTGNWIESDGHGHWRLNTSAPMDLGPTD